MVERTEPGVSAVERERVSWGDEVRRRKRKRKRNRDYVYGIQRNRHGLRQKAKCEHTEKGDPRAIRCSGYSVEEQSQQGRAEEVLVWKHTWQSKKAIQRSRQWSASL